MEKKKLLLVSVSVGLFLVIIIGVSILAFSPKNYSAADAVRAEAAANFVSVAGSRPIPPGAPPVSPIEQTPPLPVEGQPPINPPVNENAIYINGENAEKAVKVEQQNDGTPRTVINISTTQSNQNASPTESEPPPQAASTPASTAPKTAAATPAKPAAPAKTASAAPKTTTAAAKPPQAAPVPAKQTATQTPAKQAAKKTPNRSDYWVQTGSFTAKSRADNVKELLAGKGIASIVMDGNVNGKIVYRVRVGPYTTQNEANYWLALIQKINGMEGSLVFKSPARL